MYSSVIDEINIPCHKQRWTSMDQWGAPVFLIYYWKHFHCRSKVSWVKAVNYNEVIFCVTSISMAVQLFVCGFHCLAFPHCVFCHDQFPLQQMTRFPASHICLFAFAILLLFLAHLILWQVSRWLRWWWWIFALRLPNQTAKPSPQSPGDGGFCKCDYLLSFLVMNQLGLKMP